MNDVKDDTYNYVRSVRRVTAPAAKSAVFDCIFLCMILVSKVLRFCSALLVTTIKTITKMVRIRSVKLKLKRIFELKLYKN